LIKSINADEPWVVDLVDQMKEGLASNLPLLEKHLRSHDSYLNFLKLVRIRYH
jgi:hypothetical protein